MIVSGMGMGLVKQVRAELSVSTTPERTGVSSGVKETFRQIGSAVGTAGHGALFTRWSVPAAISASRVCCACSSRNVTRA